MKFILHPSLDEHRLARLREAVPEHVVINCETAEQSISEIADADAFYGKLTPDLLAAANRLRWVQSPTASLEHYLFPSLIEHPCTLTNMRGIFSDVIAEHVLAYLLCITRQLHTYIRQQTENSWKPVGGEAERTSFATGPGVETAIDRCHHTLAGTTLGLVGVGAIGSEICRKAAALGMHVLGIDPVAQTVPGILEEVWPLDCLPDLLQQSDYVCIAAPHTPQTEKLFRSEQFRQMKPTAWLINIGRGAIIDLSDLVTALQNKTIAGAALDVFETEPLPADHPLWTTPNAILTPHIAAASTLVPRRHLETLLENVRRFANDEPLLNVVDKHRWF
ncbi:D-2-hydroxyacid dehydrogenase [Planctomicrobium piriforme]|uniref:Phosphoglycerate dehydrogenase n=1 Tax=Planctomicrobium piriforme TaxID=1576369 RepID=A0A1I3NIY0_9PLAN|nr:D-2-hydroxyacid dehydrogenase [Planctomicrobium piriforme]SFJ09231.1 Phosphoglycerate dehydrogenase [Planctomicrobium piriforme]